MMMVPNKLACYIVNSNESDGCMFFVARECSAGKNAHRLDGRVVKIMQA
jgi:hypothetical protein